MTTLAIAIYKYLWINGTENLLSKYLQVLSKSIFPVKFDLSYPRSEQRNFFH